MCTLGLLASTSAVADLKTDRSVILNDGTHKVSATARFSKEITGDLYIATQIAEQLIFIIEGGASSLDPTPFIANSTFSDDISILEISGEGIPPGEYPLFKLIVLSGASPLDVTNWIGGINGLSKINFIIGLPVEESLDFNDDGFPDDDLNRDGFHD